ncbi:MAG TPA: FAD-binding protein, partial [Dictyobacter sp.]|nr:FAD-binding protein [Dictyobacter sp.]
MSQDPGVASDRHISVSMFSGTFSADEADCLRVASDFGALIHMMPDAVLLPASAEDVVHVVQYARQQQQQLAPRGQGHSTYGQAQSAHGIVIDTSTLNTIDAIYPDRVEVSGGVLWQDLVRATLQQGFIPPVVPDYLGLSIGGTLALGGVGVTSYRCGSIADQVYELQVVTGEGQLYICSPTQHADLFASMLGGLGQCGIIVKATLKLQPAYTRARVYRALYPSLLALVKELDHFVRTERTCVDAVIGLLIPSSSGSWNYLLEVAKFYTPGEREPEDKKVLDLLHNVAGTEHFEDVSYVDYIQRVSTQSQALDALGIWQRPHPWLDLF